MGTLFSALDIARAGMFAAQVQLDVAGHNIANVNTEGFSRQRVDLTTRQPNFRVYGAVGRGPAVAGVERIRENFLDQVFRRQNPSLGSAQTQATYYSRIEDMFQEPGERGFAQRINVFFDSLNDFANNVESLPGRVALMSEAEALAASLRDADQRLNLLRTNANEEIRGLVPEVNSLSRRIAEINQAIRVTEATGRTANDLRDTRDLLLDQMSSLVFVTTRERDDGQIDVVLGDEQLVNGSIVRELETFIDPSLDPTRPDLLNVRFQDTGEVAAITNGQIFGLFHMRDNELREFQGRFDTLAAGLIESINHIHTQGVGLQRLSGNQTALNGASDITLPLNQAGLPFQITDGGFQIIAYNNTGAIAETITIPITASGPDAGQTTLSNIVTAINASASVTASIDANNRLILFPNGGNTIHFANDSSGVLGALGLNVFFTGSDAGSIGVNQALLNNPALISSGGFNPNGSSVPSPGTTGDNSAALALASVRNTKSLENGQQTLNEFFESTVALVGVRSRANLATMDVERAFVADFQRRRQEISGVNLDEEVTNLLQFQRAFEGAARVVTVADRMLETLLNIVR